MSDIFFNSVLTNFSLRRNWSSNRDILCKGSPGFQQLITFHTVLLFSCYLEWDTLGTPWIGAHKAPLWDFSGKNIGVGCHFLSTTLKIQNHLERNMLVSIAGLKSYF